VSRELKFAQAILEATDQCMARDSRVYLMGLGVPDPKGTFGTTVGLQAKYGPSRVMDMPTAESTMTGVGIGSAIVGMRPIMTHQRVDFFLLAFDQLLNNGAKWHYMFGGRMNVPIVIRLIIGRGWGQGPQHSQSLQAMFAHVPGLKVVMPATPSDAKGLLISAIEDDNPVIYLEHRWLHGTFGPVAEEMYRVPIGKARTIRMGADVTIVSCSHMTVEALRAADELAADGINAEVVDLRSIKPLDEAHVLESVRKTGRLVVADAAWRSVGVAAEILALTAEHLHGELKAAPKRVTFPDVPTPTSWALAQHFYPRSIDIANAVRAVIGGRERRQEAAASARSTHDVPDTTFTGPF